MNEDELELDLDNIQADAEQKVKVKNRFEKLSTDVILKSKERDDALAKVKTEEDARQNAEKERDFYKSFATNATKYPNASEYQDKILEKVKSGYDVEDAMVVVLAKEGKLNAQQEPEPQPQFQAIRPEGGSAATIQVGTKSPNEMSTDEKFAKLQELDKTGELGAFLRGQI